VADKKPERPKTTHEFDRSVPGSLYDPATPKRWSSLFAVFESAATGLRSGNLRSMDLSNTFANARTRFQTEAAVILARQPGPCGDVYHGNLEIPCLKLLQRV
jgi:hypothetical protein